MFINTQLFVKLSILILFYYNYIMAEIHKLMCLHLKDRKINIRLISALSNTKKNIVIIV